MIAETGLQGTHINYVARANSLSDFSRADVPGSGGVCGGGARQRDVAGVPAHVRAAQALLPAVPSRHHRR